VDPAADPGRSLKSAKFGEFIKEMNVAVGSNLGVAAASDAAVGELKEQWSKPTRVTNPMIKSL